MFKRLSVGFTVFCLAFLSTLSQASLPTNSEKVAAYFSAKFNRAENQKELLESFELKKEQKKEIVDFLRKYRKEGLPVPRATQKHSVLELKYNDGISSIDFEKVETSTYKIDGNVIQIAPSDKVETIFNKMKTAKVNGISRQAPFFWIRFAEAASLPDENKAAYAAVCLRVAEMQKEQGPNSTNSQNAGDQKHKGSAQKQPATR